MAKRQWEKLAPRFCGPLVITERIGKLAYRLELPSSARIHSVFYVSQLKKAVGSQPVSQIIPPQLTSDLVMDVQPAELRGVRNTGARKAGPEVWTGLPDWEATWEDFQQINELFPAFHLEDKVNVWARGNARNLRGPTEVLTFQRKGRKGKRNTMAENDKNK